MISPFQDTQGVQSYDIYSSSDTISRIRVGISTNIGITAILVVILISLRIRS